MKTEVLKNFIVLEGLDGSGTTTQLNSLYNQLKDSNINAYKTFEPTDNKIGSLIRKVLRKEYSMEPKTISKLFVADRYEHIFGRDGIIEQTKNGNIVICDRYLFSSLAYQSPECDYDFVYNLNKDFPIPEYLFFIDVDVDTCQSRITKRGEEKELFENTDYQKKVLDFYNKALTEYKDSEMKIHRIDGKLSPEEITNIILETIR